jgi:hypothetical protein
MEYLRMIWMWLLHGRPCQYFDLTNIDFQGCLCSNEPQDISTSDHDTDYPKHAEFRSSTLEDAVPEVVIRQEQRCVYGRAYSHRCAEQSFYDKDGEMLHQWEAIPTSCIMTIAPSRISPKSSMIYRILGLGRVYLKSWLAASLSFETIVLD